MLYVTGLPSPLYTTANKVSLVAPLKFGNWDMGKFGILFYKY